MAWDDEYYRLYKVDADDEWRNSAYDENGDCVVCDICSEEMKWSGSGHEWFCPGCGQKKTRIQFFNHIGAEPPGSDCLTRCNENYPFCKKYCDRYPIDPDDPMLD